MNPKNVEKIGKGFFVAIIVAVVVGTKKYGPKIIERIGKALKNK